MSNGQDIFDYFSTSAVKLSIFTRIYIKGPGGSPCNHSYLGGGDLQDQGLRPAWAKSLLDLASSNGWALSHMAVITAPRETQIGEPQSRPVRQKSQTLSQKS
jgi:hypothetical protein